MQSHELLKEVLKKTSAKQIAGEMGLSLSLIYKWAEPPAEATGSGANNPLDRLAQIVAQSWFWVGGFVTPTDATATTTIIPTAGAQYLKRAVVIEHV